MRKVALIYKYSRCAPNAYKAERERRSKIPKNLRTSFMNGPKEGNRPDQPLYIT